MYPDEAIEIEDPFAVEEKLEMEVFAVHDFYLGTRSWHVKLWWWRRRIWPADRHLFAKLEREFALLEIAEEIEIAEEMDDDEASNDFDLPLRLQRSILSRELSVL